MTGSYSRLDFGGVIAIAMQIREFLNGFFFYRRGLGGQLYTNFADNSRSRRRFVKCLSDVLSRDSYHFPLVLIQAAIRIQEFSSEFVPLRNRGSCKKFSSNSTNND